jgi:hypothetical protein
MPSLVPHTRQNAVWSTRTALPQPPANVYIPPIDVCDPLARALPPPPASIEAGVYIPPFDRDCNPIDHTLPHKDPPAFFVETAWEAAAEFVEELEDNTSGDGRVNLEDTFDDLVGNKKSGLDDLSYSSDEDNKDYDNNMEEEAHLIENSDVKNVCNGQRQTNFIPGGPKPFTYSGMNAVEKALAKAEYTKKRKQYTDGLQMKQLHNNNVDYQPESFSSCLALVLRSMLEVQQGHLEANHMFLDREILAMRVAEEANL